jgi:hypothetical protein
MVWKEGLWLYLRYCPRICLEGLSKTTINLSLNIRSLGWVVNAGSPECEAGGCCNSERIVFITISYGHFSVYSREWRNVDGLV